jgi:hypothetical protein
MTSAEVSLALALVVYLHRRKKTVDSDEFHEWQKGIDGEVVAATLAKDPLFATRFHIKEELKKLTSEMLPAGVDSVTAMPVYGTRAKYDAAAQNLAGDMGERLTLEVVLPNLQVPADHVSLPDIVELREREDYQESLYSLRKWQRETIPKLLGENNERALREAGEEFARHIKMYQKAMSDATYDKVQTGVCSILAVGATLAVGAAPLIVMASGVAPAVFSLRSLLTPCWKQVMEKDCAPAGIVYLTSQL